VATTPNMGIVKPVPLSDSNLAGANEVNAGFDVVDAHNHTAGRGLQIPTLGLNINAALPMNGFGLTGLGTNIFSNQLAPVAGAAGYFYMAKGGGGTASGDLFFHDGNNQRVQLTLSGQVNVTGVGAISGLAPPAAASYAAGVFTWQSNTTGPIPAVMDMGDIVLRRAGATNPNGIVIRTVSSLVGSFILTLPPALPGSNLAAMVSDTSGNLTFSALVDTTTLTNTGSVIQIATGGVGTTQLAANAVTAPKIAARTVTGEAGAPGSGNIALATIGTTNYGDGSVTQVKQGSMATGGAAVSSTASNTPVQVASASITSLASAGGRGVLLTFFPGSSFQTGSWAISNAGTGGTLTLTVKVAGSQVASWSYSTLVDAGIPLPSFVLTSGFSAGSTTVALFASVSAGATLTATNLSMLLTQL